jgi:hypothetical protein
MPASFCCIDGRNKELHDDLRELWATFPALSSQKESVFADDTVIAENRC